MAKIGVGCEPAVGSVTASRKSEYKVNNRLHEGKRPLYAIAFNFVDARYFDVFATVGANRDFLEAKVDEAHKLSNRIEDLELQPNKEEEDCKRITSKVKKFIQAYGRYVKAQDELKGSQARLQSVGKQLGSDISKPGANEEDSSVNIVGDGEPNGDYRRSPRNEHKNDASV